MNKLSLYKLKNLIDSLNCHRIYTLSCQCDLITKGLNVDYASNYENNLSL